MKVGASEERVSQISIKSMNWGFDQEPEFIIMDEPTMGIDPQSRSFILDTVRELRNQGSTILYTTHYMEEVESLCDRIYIMDHGKIIAEGSKESLSKT